MKSDLNSSILYGTQQHEVLSIKDRNHTKATGEGYADDVDECDLSDPNSLRSWRVRDRMKTVSVALVLCLNIGVDPPGVVKPNPCARMECWIDPLSMPAQRALDTIGKYLQQQYERWQPRARYKISADPTVEEVKKLCTALRRNAKDERVLLHYNGHGVPLPTTNGEVWVFNRSYTQYIPLSIYDLQIWMGTPSIFVFDCSAAELIVSSFKTFAKHREKEQDQAGAGQGSNPTQAGDENNPSPNPYYKECILLAACASNEILPTNPDLPADLFTACLTTPIKMALRWFAPRSLLGIGIDKLDKIPGRLNDRKTPLGELNWIFTAITDTIAWNVLPRDLFKKLFRQDLLVASLFRNFLLAERIMWTVNCTPVSEPELPSTHSHPLWQAWDYTVEQCLAQLPSMLAAEDASQEQSSPGFGTRGDPRGPREEGKIYSMDSDPQPLPEAFQYTPNTFFEDQMTAFEVWLAIGPEGDQPPEKLPIVLQVLLSQAHRLRALRLLSRFLQIGAWAINHALSVGIFPYVLKLLQSQIPELRRELVFIWGKLLALDTSCVLDLVKENGQVHFVDFLMNASAPPVCLAMSAFVLSVITAKFPDQLQDETVISACVGVLNHEHPLVRRWACLCFAKRIKSSNMSCQHIVLNSGIRQQLFDLARSDEACDVRTSALGVLMLLVSNLLASGNQMEQVKSDEDLATRAKQIAMEQMRVLEEVLALLAGIVENDASPLVRREIALGLEEAVTERKADFNALVESGSKESIASDAAQSIISILLILESDPHPIVSGITRRINSVVNFLGDKNNTQQERKDNTSAEAPKDNVFVSISHMLETVLNGKGNKHESQGNDLESVYNKVPFVSSGSPELVNCALEDMPSTYAIFCRSVLNLRYEGPGNLEPYIAEEKVGVKFTSARKQLFESDMKSRWAAEMEDKLPANLREVLNLRLGVGELWSSAFLPMDPMLVVGDALGVVSIWNTDTEALETQFGIPRADPQGICGITSLCVLEGNIESPIIAAGAGDGVASIWTRRGSKEEERIVSIWNASGSMEWSLASLNSEKHRTAHGLKMSWNPHRLQLVAAGCEGGVLRLWNVASEICGGSIRAFTGESVTALDTRISTCVVGGTSGTVSLVDLGMQEHGSSLIFGSSGTSNAHGSAVVAVQQQQINDHLTTVLSAERDGMVKLWDVRNPSQALMQSEPLMGELTDMVAHDTLPNVIVVSGRSEVKLIDSHGRTTRELQYHEGFLSQRLSPITSLSLHSRKPVLAVGCADSEVSLYECADF